MSIFRTHFFVRATFVVALVLLWLVFLPYTNTANAQFLGTGPNGGPGTTEETDAIIGSFGPGSNNLQAAEDLLFSQPVSNTGRVPGDLDGDGTSDSAAAYFQEVAARDTNGDGRISAEEQAAAREDNQDNGLSAAEIEALRRAAVAEAELTIYNVLVRFGGWVAGLGGTVFDKSFEIFVIELGCMFVDTCDENESSFNGQVGGVVDIIWTIIRDLFNILFIFALVYIGLRLILLSDDSRTKKDIGNLIIAALLINFSLFIAKLVVDITNFTASSIYTSMSTKIRVEFATQSYELGNNTISGAFMGVLKIVTFFRDSSDSASVGAEIFFSMIAMFFLCFLGIVFLYGAFMMMARFIGIVILLMLSPAMFLGLILPAFADYSRKWRKMFLAYCFYAPAFVFMIYVSLFTLSQLATELGQSTYSAAIAPNRIQADSFTIYLLLFLGFGFLYASFKVSDILSKNGAGATMNFAHNMGRRMTYGAAAVVGAGIGAWGYRNTVGAGADAVRRGIDATDAVARDSSRSRSTRFAAAAARTGLSLTGGGSARVARRQMTAARDNGAFGGASFSDVEKDEKERDKRAGTANAGRRLNSAISAAAAANPNDPEEVQRTLIQLEEQLSSASPNDLIEFAQTNGGPEALARIAGSIPQAKWDKLMESEAIKTDQKRILHTGRTNSTHTNIARRANADVDTADRDAVNTAMREGLNRAKTDELSSVNFEQTLLPNAWRLQKSQLDDLEKQWKSPTKSQLLSDAREQQIEGILQGGPNAPQGVSVNDLLATVRNEKELAKLGVYRDEGNRQAIFNAIINNPDGHNFRMNRNLLKNFGEEINEGPTKAALKNTIENFYQGNLPGDIDDFFENDRIGMTFTS